MGVSTNDVNKNKPLIFPNPNKGRFNLEFEANENEKVFWDVFSINGTLISSGNFYGKSQQIDIHSEAQGTYVLLVRHNNKFHTLKIIKK